MAGTIAARARQSLALRMPVGSYNQATNQVEVRPLDATDVAGMLEPILTALGELEAKLTEGSVLTD